MSDQSWKPAAGVRFVAADDPGVIAQILFPAELRRCRIGPPATGDQRTGACLTHPHVVRFVRPEPSTFTVHRSNPEHTKARLLPSGDQLGKWPEVVLGTGTATGSPMPRTEMPPSGPRA